VLRGRILGGAPPPRFLLHVLAVVAVLVVILLVRPGLTPDGAVSTPGAAPSTVDTHRHAEDEGGLYVPTGGHADRAAAREVAVAFVTAWARPTLAPGPWWDGVARYAEPGYAKLLRTVDPANVPADRVTGTARVVSSEPGLMVFDVPTGTGTCQVTVADASGNGVWKVSTHRWTPGSQP
jgi:hypothetical protein